MRKIKMTDDHIKFAKFLDEQIEEFDSLDQLDKIMVLSNLIGRYLVGLKLSDVQYKDFVSSVFVNIQKGNEEVIETLANFEQGLKNRM